MRSSSHGRRVRGAGTIRKNPQDKDATRTKSVIKELSESEVTRKLRRSLTLLNYLTRSQERRLSHRSLPSSMSFRLCQSALTYLVAVDSQTRIGAKSHPMANRNKSRLFLSCGATVSLSWSCLSGSQLQSRKASTGTGLTSLRLNIVMSHPLKKTPMIQKSDSSIKRPIL